MLRALLFISLLLQSLASLASASELLLDLDQPIDQQLLPYSQFQVDVRQVLNFDRVRQQGTRHWSRFYDKQFQQGFTSHPIWVNSTFTTTGKQPRDVAFMLHQVMDSIELEISVDGKLSQHITLGKGVPPGPHHLPSYQNLNHFVMSLEPNRQYQIVMNIRSANPVVGAFRAVDDNTVILESQKQNQWVFTLLIVTLLVSAYNLMIYVSTRNVPFLYHVGYVSALMSYLLNDYGYLSAWLNLYDPAVLQKLTGLSLITAYLFIVSFFDSMNHFNRHSPIIRQLNRYLIVAGYVLLICLFVLSYDHLIRLLSIQVLLTIAIEIYISYHRQKHFGHIANPHKRTLNLITLIFAPSLTVHMFNRLGFIDANMVTDFVLFFSTIVEVIVISFLLITGMRNSNEAAQRELVVNTLSGLPNYRALRTHYETTQRQTRKSLIMIWVSGLDKFEVAFGQNIYQAFLSGLAKQIQQRLNDSDLLIPLSAKYNGQFPLFHSDKNTLCLLCKPLSRSEMQSLQTLLEQSIDATRQNHHDSIDLTLSIGAHNFDNDQSSFDAEIRKCQLALSYSIKNNLPLKFYDEQIGFNERKHINLLKDFTQSLSGDGFYLLWQPQYDTRHKRITGVEVLARWRHDDYGEISPAEFIPILEQSDRICKLSQWVISKVLETMPDLHDKHPGIEVSINLSPRDLLVDGLIDFLDSHLQQYAEYAPFITLEVTETVMISDYSKVLDVIKQLQARGFNISVDDFGSGYASFAYLQRLPVNELKIDKCYTDFYREETTYAILETIIELAKRLNMRIVVEGVEHQQQIDLFTNLGAERLQGWGLDKPMSLECLLGKT